MARERTQPPADDSNEPGAMIQPPDVPERPDVPDAEAAMSPVEKAMMMLLEKLPAALAGAAAAGAIQPDHLRAILKEVTIGTAEATRKAMWPENPDHPHISAYSYPEGDKVKKKPTLSRNTYFCGAEEKEDRLTPAEILGYNAIVEPRLARGGAWRAEIRPPRSMGHKGDLFVWVPSNTVDQRMVLPPLTAILLELNGGPSTENVLDLLRQIEQLKAMLIGKGGVTAADLESQLLAGTVPAMA